MGTSKKTTLSGLGTVLLIYGLYVAVTWMMVAQAKGEQVLNAIEAPRVVASTPTAPGPERDQAERDLRDSYEGDRVAEQAAGDDLGRQGALVQRRIADLQISMREYIRRVEADREAMRVKFMAAITTELDATLTATDDLSARAFTGFPVLVETPGVTLRDVWSRPGPRNVIEGKIAGDLQDAYRIYRADGVRLENVSASGAVDECIEIADSRGVTLYRALISDPVDEPGIHPKGTPHGHGLIVVGQRRQGVWGDWAPVVIQECLFANCGGRSPTLKPGYPYGGENVGELRVQLINTVSYNPNRFALKLNSTDPANHVGNILRADIVGNLIIVGPDTDVDQLRETLQAGQYDHVYAANNWIELRDGTRHDLFEWAGVAPGQAEPTYSLPDYIDDPEELFAVVLAHAGARPRDEHDARVVAQVEMRD